MLKNIKKLKSFKNCSFKKYSSFNKAIKKISTLSLSFSFNHPSSLNKRILKQYSTSQSNAIQQENSPKEMLEKESQSFQWSDSINLFMELKILGDKLGYHWMVEDKYMDQDVEMKDWSSVDPIYIPIKSWTYNFR
jgi:hypothetical protein